MLKADKLGISFTQAKVKYCPACYDGINDENEDGIDCGGDCTPCKPESKPILPVPIPIANLTLWALAAGLLIPIVKMSGAYSILVSLIKKLIKTKYLRAIISIPA